MKSITDPLPAYRGCDQTWTAIAEDRNGTGGVLADVVQPSAGLIASPTSSPRQELSQPESVVRAAFQPRTCVASSTFTAQGGCAGNKESLGSINGRSPVKNPECEECGSRRRSDIHPEQNHVQSVAPTRQNGIQPHDCRQRPEDAVPNHQPLARCCRSHCIVLDQAPSGEASSVSAHTQLCALSVWWPRGHTLSQLMLRLRGAALACQVVARSRMA